MKKFPRSYEIDWRSLVFQVIWLALFMLIANELLPGLLLAPLVGMLVYLVYILILKSVIERPINLGMRSLNEGEFIQAITQFEDAYAFYTRHAWIDRIRYFILLSSTSSYREMALVDIAVCYSQIGEGEKSKRAYERVLAEFPNNRAAQVALKAIQAFESR